MNPATAHLPAPSSFVPPVHSPSPGTDPQNLPSIANLIHSSQLDGASQQSNVPTPQSLNQSRFPQPPAHGQSLPNAQQPMPNMSQDQSAASGQPAQTEQAAVQQAARQTKGKYSLADFEILRTLGTGSFGRVHLVQSRHNQRFYAVKVLKKGQVVKMKQVEHTNDERRMLGEVKHPFLITLWGTFQDSKNLYMVMDFVEGGELFSLLRKSGRFPNPVAKFYAAEVTWSLGILIYEMLCGYTPFWDSGSPMKIYENILRGKVKYPAYINPDAQDLLERLITADLTKRLGNLYGGPKDVKQHAWFAEVTWDRLARKDIDAPYTPPVKAGAGDASQFDRYPEDPERYGTGGHDEYGHLFPDF
ncbi:hypothetical protein VSDG_04473 [Cytospora chrysosperma]|uniref:cAMP-dependent protein kinase n=1 Tax=Cytospora chrysosperma TaxID=252740 RepID=A0A423W4G3_CYTCH|nr:hypothetical protein VSDG_04473 [Valsa sordida]